MAITTTSLADPIGAKVLIDTDADATVEQALTSGATIYQIQISNTLNSSTAVTLKIADVASNASTSSAISHQFTCPGGDRVSYIFNTGITLSAGLAFWCTTSIAASDTNSPTNDVEVRFLTS